MIPREIDELMWTIAEGTDHSAIEAFGDRYPNLREELLRRIRTVNALKSGNKSLKSAKVPTKTTTPRFSTKSNNVPPTRAKMSSFWVAVIRPWIGHWTS